MDQGRTVNKVLRDMKAFEIIPEDKAGEARIFLNQIWVAAWEQRTKELSAHHNKKVIQYNRRDQEIARFNTIAEAARANKCSRDVVDDSVTGRIRISRKGYYFRYAEHEKGDNRDTDIGREG